MRLSVISDEIEDLRDLVFDRGKKDSPKLGTMQFGKENDIWDIDEISLGCGILVKKRAGKVRDQDPSSQNLFIFS